MSDHLEQNAKQLARLRTVIGELTEGDMNRVVADEWTVSALLAHLAFWDRWTMVRWDRYVADGVFDEIPDRVLDFVNAAALPQWLAISGDTAAEMAVTAASEAAAYVAALPQGAITAALSSGRPAMVDRTLHWGPHLEAIERALTGGG